ncbi:hypothetical protein OD91_2249 [Lutibacter sp. Hel_I_33_5]|nr:hypothetical protein OD91_2249 [Lutibacter sp. Hel_I_33_5]
MGKAKNLLENNNVNFSLRGITSILIGIYILLAAYAIKYFGDGFLNDENPVAFMSIEILEILGVVLLIFVFIFSTLALFFSGRRNARKEGYFLWNKKTKVQRNTYLLLSFIFIIVFSFINNISDSNFITPFFLIFYAVFTTVLNTSKNKNIYLIALLCLLLAIIVFLIPTYWYSSLLILGVAHIVNGIISRT